MGVDSTARVSTPRRVVSLLAFAARPRARAALGALAGSLAWVVLAALLPSLPNPIRFFVVLPLFLFGSGAIVAGFVSRGAPSVERVVVVLAFGMAAAPALAEVLAWLGIDRSFPFVVCAAAGATIAVNGKAAKVSTKF